MTLRTMTPADYAAAYALWLATPGMGMNPRDDAPESIARYLRRNPSTCFVALDNGALVGVILCGHDGRRGFIYHMAVSAACRRQGVGRRLVEHALDALRREGIAKVALVAFTRNEEGNAFWEKLGFTARDDLVYRNLEFSN